MGIRTRGFTKTSQKSGGDGGECTASSVSLVKQEILEREEAKKESCVEKKELNSEEKLTGSPVKSCAVRPRVTFQRSPLKLRTPTSMARLGGIKAAARKLKKHRKRNLIVQSATKILRSSIKSNKTRRPCRPEEKPRTNGVTLPSRVSTRTLVRRTSREGIPEMPLRTVELIKRPLELREPATKLLYMASLGLYPKTGESDMTPIVVIKELNCSPGKKNGVRKSLELPLIPASFQKRFMDLSSQDKQIHSENIKPGSKQQPKKENRKTPPVEKKVAVEPKKPANGRKTPVTTPPPPPVEEAPKPSINFTSEDCSISISLQQKPVKKAKTSPIPSPKLNGLVNTTIVPVVAPKQTSAWSITPVPSKAASPVLPEINKLSPNSSSPKSLLKNNIISPTSSFTKDTSVVTVSAPLNLTSNLPSKVEPTKSSSTESLLASSCSVAQAMNLFMSNITIIPSSNPPNSRKRSADDSSENASSRNYSLHSLTIPNIAEKKPPKKRQRNNGTEKKGRFSLPISVAPVPNVVSNGNNSINLGSLFQPIANVDEALNLCMKKPVPEILPPPVQLPPKLQLNSNINIQKVNKNGTKPLNLIIPRPPPLMKAPLEVANYANCTQNIQPLLPVTKGKPQPKKPKKSRQNTNINNNQLNQSNLQIQDSLPVLPTLPLPPGVDTTVAKSLLKCMNGGEENTCAREIGESLDSVKTMLSRLQTRIGPAVNGVRLITIE